MSFEVDPARLDAKDDINENRNNLVTLTERVFGAIVSSADKFPPQLRSMCHCLYQVLSKRYPQFPQNNIGAVGTVIFLRFINPAIGSLLHFSVFIFLKSSIYHFPGVFQYLLTKWASLTDSHHTPSREG